MDNFLTIIALIIPGIATLLNVLVVAKRYHRIKKEDYAIDKLILEINQANSHIKEVKVKNNGQIGFNERQKEELRKIIQEIDCEVNERQKKKEIS